ncbi:MAG: type II toxin-antitoxin system RelE/ParE family toxin [Clostridia bacterium]|nr:type II toxin-antitoxin system RelE/ParE family toxin [Clostridia bacterium]
MTYRLLVSNNADLQLEKILRYVAIKLDNPTAAAAILEDVKRTYIHLEHMPEAVALCEDPYLAAFGYRKIKLRDHDYVILFRLADDIVQISGIFHMRENYIMKL